MTRARALRPRTLVVLLALLAAPLSCERPAQAAFEGRRAQDWIAKQCAFGPRAPGTAAHDSCLAFLVATLRGYAPVVEVDTFTYDSPDLGREVRLANVLARFRPEQKTRILFGAHWDTRPWADMEPDSSLHRLPILGANDGASGVAVLLELARNLQRTKPALGVDLVLFDGEDLGTASNPAGFFRGSQRYVEWKRDDRAIFVIIVDMVGRRRATFYPEINSRENAGNIVDLVWNEARDLGIRRFDLEPKHRIFDDHIPFLNDGIPAIDIIEFGWPEWHTLRDTPAICAPEPLEDVGRVLLSLSTKASFLSR